MSKAKECRRILASGARCHALAIKGTPYCYFHQAVRSFDQENRTRHRSIVVPKIEDRAAIHITLMSVLDAIGSAKMDPVRGRLYLYGLQLAMTNIGANNNQLACADSVSNPVCDDGGEFLAPEDEEESYEPLPTNELICSEPISLPLPNAAEKSSGDAPGESFENGPEQGISPAPDEAATSDTNPHQPADLRAVGATFVSPALQRGESIPQQASSPVGTTQITNGASAPEENEQTFDISAAAEPGTPLACYGAHAWDFDYPELSDEELQKHKSIARTVRFLARDLNAVQPFRSPTDRRFLSAQLHAEYFTKYLAREPDPLPCTVATRYFASLLS